MELHAGHHHVVQWMGISFNMDTLYMTWLVMAIIIVVTLLATRSRAMVPQGIQNVMESVLEGLTGQFKTNLGNQWKFLSSILFTYFLFILVSNELGLIPSPHILALAISSSILVWIVGLKVKGIGYFKHFVQPFKLFIIINLMEEIAKPVTLAFRLFGNILAGEILLELLYALVPYVLPIVWLAFSLAIGIIQAFIFAMLVTSYLGMTIGDGH